MQKGCEEGSCVDECEMRQAIVRPECQIRGAKSYHKFEGHNERAARGCLEAGLWVLLPYFQGYRVAEIAISVDGSDSDHIRRHSPPGKRRSVTGQDLRGPIASLTRLEDPQPRPFGSRKSPIECDAAVFSGRGNENHSAEGRDAEPRYSLRQGG